MTGIKFNKAFSCEYGVAEEVSPLVRRIVADNPGPFTYYGTGTYIIGQGEVAIVDPGPADRSHIDALLAATRGETITHILVTHTHLDHSPGCRLLRQHTDAPTYGYGPHGSGRILAGDVVEEGADTEFAPDITVKHGDKVHGSGWSVECVHTPGHTSNHVCYQLCERRTLFCGDHVMAWSTSIIAPPDGNLTDYMESLRLLLGREDGTYFPCHGPPISDPRTFVQSYIDHRQHRVEQVIGCLKNGYRRIDQMVPRMYSDLPQSMHPAAARSVLSSLIYLCEQGLVTTDRLDLQGIYQTNSQVGSAVTELASE